MTNSDPTRKETPEASPELIRDLQQLYATTPAVPLAVDEKILAEARSSIGHKSRRTLVFKLASATAAAAAVTFAVLQTNLVPQEPTPGEPVLLALREDVDGNGRVDILDAFALARTIKKNETAMANLDINGDGVVNEEDIDAVAMAAVSITTG
ncbi:MAG: dockerin type I repeat-containing protein [Planctomycetota bacterium]|jgi:hypothetical protein